MSFDKSEMCSFLFKESYSSEITGCFVDGLQKCERIADKGGLWNDLHKISCRFKQRQCSSQWRREKTLKLNFIQSTHMIDKGLKGCEELSGITEFNKNDQMIRIHTVCSFGGVQEPSRAW